MNDWNGDGTEFDPAGFFEDNFKSAKQNEAIANETQPETVEQAVEEPDITNDNAPALEEMVTPDESEQVAESSTTEEAPVQESEPESNQEDAQLAVLTEMKEAINKHFSVLQDLVRFSKTKDANVLLLSKQLQEYRDGFAKGAYKRIALELIAFREECRKNQRDFAKGELTKENAAKYAGFLCDDYYDLMQNLGISCKDGNYFYNGKSLQGECDAVAFKDVPMKEAVSLPTFEINTFEDLVEYLKTVENTVVEVLKDNTVLDSLLGDYINAASVYDQGLYQVVLYPTIRHIINLYEILSKKVNDGSAKLEDDGAKDFYLLLLKGAIKSLEVILSFIDVDIDSNEESSALYDAKKHRVLKFLSTDDPEQNGKIACYYTNCYTMDDKVIYPAKVDIYKAKQ